MGKNTNTAEALIQTRLQCFNSTTGDRPSIVNVAIMVTYGTPFPSDKKEPAIHEAAALRNKGITLIAIGVTHGNDFLNLNDFLKEISSPPHIEDQNYFMATDFSALSKITANVVEVTCRMFQRSQFVSF